MPGSSDPLNRQKWIALFGLWILHGVFTLWQDVNIFIDGQQLSFPHLVMGGFLLFWLILNIVLTISAFRGYSWWLKTLAWLGKPHVRDVLFGTTLFIVLCRVGAALFRGLLSGPSMDRYGVYMDRLSPLFDLLTFVSFEIILLVVFYGFKSNSIEKNTIRQFSFKMLIVLAVLGLIASVISMTGLGIVPGYKGDWSRGLPAVPLLEWQIILACVFCIVMVFFESKESFFKFPHLDVWIGIFVWLFTVFVWLSQPVIPNASALKPHEPNFEVYPFIDSQTYDVFSQSVLVGEGFGGAKIPQRPLYIVFLTLAHVLVGQNYDDVIAFQTLFFAFFPVLLYFFGKQFFGRPVGVSIALLAILRDYTSNYVSPFTGNLSYSKLYLSEIPTAIFLLLFLIAAMRWIKTGLPVFSGFLLGGILGMAMLIRTQVIVAVPVIILFALLAEPKRFTALLKSMAVMFVTIVLVVSPWLWRNWHLTGAIIFDSPESQTANLALRYSRLNGIEPDIQPLPGESSFDYSDRLKKTAVDAILANPQGAFMGVANFFLNHGVNNILLFPLRNDLVSASELSTPENAFWESWAGTPTGSQTLLLIFYTLLFGLGVSVAWYRNGWLGLLPLGLNLAYNLWTSLALLSGQRFMLTMDWSVYLYYMIGLFALLSGLMFAFERGRPVISRWLEVNKFSADQPALEKKWRHYMLAGFLFLGVGASLPLSERVFPERYPVVSQDDMFTHLKNSSANRSDVDFTCLQKLYAEDVLLFRQGRAIYPRYYMAGDGESFTDAVGYKTVDEGRLVFDTVGQINGRVIVPMSQAPEFFPNASDVVVVFNRNDRGQVWFVLVEDKGVAKFYTSDFFDLSACQ